MASTVNKESRLRQTVNSKQQTTNAQREFVPSCGGSRPSDKEEGRGKEGGRGEGGGGGGGHLDPEIVTTLGLD